MWDVGKAPSPALQFFLQPTTYNLQPTSNNLPPTTQVANLPHNDHEFV